MLYAPKSERWKTIYIPMLLRKFIEVTFGDDDDVPMLVAKAIHESDPSSKPWNQVDEKKIKEKVRNAKKRLNTEVVARITYDRLRERDPEGEIEGWLKKIKELLS